MTILTTARLGIGLMALAALAACGNGDQDQANLIKSLPKAIFSKKTPPAPVSGQQLAQALAGTSASITLFVNEKSEIQFLMQDLQRNGPYRSYGSSSRQVIVMRDGMITSTRGLGGDLMSSEESALLAMVQRKAPGTANYLQRYLTPEDLTVTFEYGCDAIPGETIPVVAGEVNTSARVVTAVCTGAAGEFTNTYAVDSYGQILSSRQWLGETLGYMQTQAVRR